MKIKLLTIAALLALLASFTPLGVTGAVALAETRSSEADLPLCLPGLEDPGVEDCLLAGPAARLEELSALGITFPATPLFASLTPYELTLLPYSYALMDKGDVPVYATLEDIENNHPTGKLNKGKTKYVSLHNKAETDKGLFYQIATTEWVSADYVKKVALQNFQGYVFKQNPTVSFGWISMETTGRSAPGINAPETGTQFWREDKVFIYDSTTIDDVEWVMVGVDEWIEHRYVSRVTPHYTRPEGVPTDKWIEINLYEQTLTAYEDGNLVFATIISSGSKPFYTQPGVFQIYKKLEFDPMSGSFELDKSDYYYLEEVPYIMYYDNARAIHGAYWQMFLGHQNSHGCVNLSVADSHWMFNWANEGDYVYVWDPSGKTPTDPSLYGSGGF